MRRSSEYEHCLASMTDLAAGFKSHGSDFAMWLGPSCPPQLSHRPLLLCTHSTPYLLHNACRTVAAFMQTDQEGYGIDLHPLVRLHCRQIQHDALETVLMQLPLVLSCKIAVQHVQEAEMVRCEQPMTAVQSVVCKGFSMCLCCVPWPMFPIKHQVC